LGGAWREHTEVTGVDVDGIDGGMSGGIDVAGSECPWRILKYALFLNDNAPISKIRAISE